MLNLKKIVEKYDVVFLDVDNTLFNYTYAHERAIEAVLKEFNLKKEDYTLAKRDTKKRELKVNHHRKEFNFKNICEQNNLHFSQTLKMYEHYEEMFHRYMHADKSMLEMLKYAKSAGKKVVAITNFYILPQIKKLKLLGMAEYIDFLVTSEEYEVEKPNFALFDRALKLVGNPEKHKVIMFGDSMADNTAHLSIDYYPYNCTKLLISISGKSGAGKSTLHKVLNEVWDCSVIEGDGYHKFERHHPNWKKLTHYNPKSNNLIQLGIDIKNIYHDISNISVPIYNHSTGLFDSPVALNHDKLDVIVIDGLHSLYKEVTGDFVKIRIFIDNELADDQKIVRDTASRQKTELEVQKSIESRALDYEKYIAIQENFANFHIHVDKNMKYTITITDELEFTKYTFIDGLLVLTGDYSDMLAVVKSLMLDLKGNRYVI